VVAEAEATEGAVMIAEAIICLLLHRVGAATEMVMGGRIPHQIRVALAREGAIKEEIMALREEVVGLVEDGNLLLERVTFILGKVEVVVEVGQIDEGKDEDRGIDLTVFVLV